MQFGFSRLFLFVMPWNKDISNVMRTMSLSGTLIRLESQIMYKSLGINMSNILDENKFNH